MIVTEGKNNILRHFFDTPIVPAWQVGIIDSTGFSVIAVTDTLALHPGWNEMSIARRVCSWDVDINLEDEVVFQFLAPGTMRGYFICTDTFLWSAIDLGNVVVAAGDYFVLSNYHVTVT